tara:strand:+ start:37 stop:525 length:489 start_codon:yes stop_codon:yes gene_type:complete
MMVDKTDNPDNIIIFPKDKIKNIGATTNQGLSEKLQKNLELQKTREYVEQTVDSIALELLKRFVDMGINTKTTTFTKDLAMFVDTLRGLVYRDFGVKHPAQQMTDTMVKVKTTQRGNIAQIDYLPFVKKKTSKPFNKEVKEELKDLHDGSDMFESDIDLDDE